MKKRLALLLAFSLIFSMIPASTFLAEENDNGYYYNDDDDAPFVPILPITEPISVTPAALVAEDLTTLRFVIGETIFTRNGEPQEELEYAPFIAYDRTMVPLAAIARGLGATVGWDDTTRYVTIIRADLRLDINVDTPLPEDWGRPIIREGRTFVPLAYVAVAFGAEIDWDPDARAAYVFY